LKENEIKKNEIENISENEDISNEEEDYLNQMNDEEFEDDFEDEDDEDISSEEEDYLNQMNDEEFEDDEDISSEEEDYLNQMNDEDSFKNIDEAKQYLNNLNLQKKPIFNLQKKPILNLEKDKFIENLIDDEIQNDNIQKTIEIKENKELIKLIKWSTTNIKNISNYEEELKLLNNEEVITILKTTKTNIVSNLLDDNKEIHILKDIDNINIDIKNFILKMHKYYLICISLGLIQKKILLEKQAFYNYEHITEEINKLKDFKAFLLDYTEKQTELQTLLDIDDYFNAVQKTIGAKKK